MNVQIIEVSTGNVVAAIPIVPPGKTCIPSEQDFFATAWQDAVEAKGLDPAQRENYSFHLLR
jgi:hypothetical protein